MTEKIFTGPYAVLLKDFISFKRSAGFKMYGLENRLIQLDKFMSSRPVDDSTVGLTKEDFKIWMELSNPGVSNPTRYHRACTFRSFSEYLIMLGHPSFMPRLPKFKSDFIPYIFTRAEIAAIFRESDKLTLGRRHLTSVRYAMPTLLRMLYSTGMRIGEAVKLKHSDVNLDKGVIVLRECKNGQDRVIPISPSLKEVCKDFVRYKEKNGIPCGEYSNFFTAPDGHVFAHSCIYSTFRIILTRAGIPYFGRGRGPRLHDLRHTFCVHSLAKMSEEGNELQYSMPLLMTYMGHQSIDATNRYVRLTKYMYPQLIEKVSKHYINIFPDLRDE